MLAAGITEASVLTIALDILAAYGLKLALWFGWPGLMAGGLLGTALFPGWRISAAVGGALVGATAWAACWLAVALGLRMMGVGG
ncbi:hypothetical protein [Microbaculum marinisediminis]|uniref:Uncharacterized protein n=1 Tax=Microbaculum marinisediminis TaxID=2931392 RepID=A0AAW5R3I8_9HYPH|nr:hypothetical protein [Microbaculum sp. A6E488]MCT8974841.1 hypothetical protein [Microbaculum sp. A6E488]